MMKTPSTPPPQIFSDTYKDIYFCEEDGLEEGDHVFLKGNRLPENWAGKREFVIAETGFGTGLNFLAAWLKWDLTAKAGQHLTYISFEKFPLTPDAIREALSRWNDQIGDKLEIMLDHYPARIAGWHPIRISDDISLLLVFDDVNRALPELDAQVDAWFLDGFAPAKNPEMWSEIVFAAMAKNSHQQTTLASFTAAGIVKRGLREASFEIAKSRGYGRKRDMIYGRFLSGERKEHDQTIKTVAVIGGGLAGTNIAHRLKVEGFDIDLYEGENIAAKASGNKRGIYNPRFTAQRGPVSDFYASAFALVLRQFKRQDNIGHTQSGSLHLLGKTDKEKRLRGAAENWEWHKDHLRVVDVEEASELAGIKINDEALYLPDSGYVSPSALCTELSKNINVIHEQINSITRAGKKWSVGNKIYDAVVIAAGAGALQFDQIKDLPLHTVRGQVLSAAATEASAKLKINICYGGYCTPASDGMHMVGSTFQPWLSHTDILDEDNVAILENFEKNVPSLAGEMKSVEARAALRTASKDRFPVIGQVGEDENLYISAAHGSHGVISAALGAEIIAARLMGRPLPIPRCVEAELSPNRFKIRDSRRRSAE